MKARIVLLPGDGIGPEVCAAAREVLLAVGERGRHQFLLRDGLIGGAAIDDCGDPLPAPTLAACRDADAVLLGAVGGPRWADPALAVRPEQGLLRLREELGVYANLRPVRTNPHLAAASPLKASLLAGVDLVVVRELTGGIYFGEKRREADRASDSCAYSVKEVERIVRVAADLARKRRGKLTSVDKANVLETSRLWRSVTSRVMADEFPDVDVEHLLVDAAAMHLLSRPVDFDVIVTENLFGDILSDEASMLAGSLGVLPSASLSGNTPGLYEPVHGSAPDIAGRGNANPLGMIASIALLLRYSLDLLEEAAWLEGAIDHVIASGVLTPDLGGTCTTRDVAEAIAARVVVADERGAQQRASA